MDQFAVSMGYSLNNLIVFLGFTVEAESLWRILTDLTTSQLAPVLPYLLLVIMLIARPRGLFGTRDV